MSWDPALEELFESTITWHSYMGIDAWGNHVFNITGVQDKAHVDDVGERRGPSGQEIDVTLNPRYEWTGTIYTKVLGIRPFDKLMIPQPPSAQPLPVWVESVDTMRDEDGPHHHVIKVTGAPPFSPIVERAVGMFVKLAQEPA